MANIQELVGKIFTKVEGEVGGDSLVFSNDHEKYVFNHWQNCCESVRIEDIVGELSDLVGSPIILAEESTNHDNPPENADSFTWTFYKFATIRGYVDVRWLGESNGYYSESVDLDHTVLQ